VRATTGGNGSANPVGDPGLAAVNAKGTNVLVYETLSNGTLYQAGGAFNGTYPGIAMVDPKGIPIGQFAEWFGKFSPVNVVGGWCTNGALYMGNCDLMQWEVGEPTFSISYNGASGSTTYQFYALGVDGTGNLTGLAFSGQSPMQVQNAASSLSSSNYITVSVATMPYNAPTTYTIYRRDPNTGYLCQQATRVSMPYTMNGSLCSPSASVTLASYNATQYWVWRPHQLSFTYGAVLQGFADYHTSGGSGFAWSINSSNGNINTKGQYQVNGSQISSSNLGDGPFTQILKASLSTSSGTSDNVSITGATSSSHCALSATNSSAAVNITSTYISAKSSNHITVTHRATSGMTYDIVCTPN